jgi:hypothetical protein
MMTQTTKHNCGVCDVVTDNETDAYGLGVRVCDTCATREDWSYGELADFTHPLQVAVFGWCSCEDNEGNENPYADCPKEEN